MPFQHRSVVSHRRTEEEEEKSKNVWIKGDTGMPYSQQKTIALQQALSQTLAA